MEIVKCVVLSTGHLPEDEYNDLRNFSDVFENESFGFTKSNHDNGIIVGINILENGEKDYTEDEFPTLDKIIKFCQSNDLRYIDFDQDGPVEKEFEAFDW